MSREVCIKVQIIYHFGYLHFNYLGYLVCIEPWLLCR